MDLFLKLTIVQQSITEPQYYFMCKIYSIFLLSAGSKFFLVKR